MMNKTRTDSHLTLAYIEAGNYDAALQMMSENGYSDMESRKRLADILHKRGYKREAKEQLRAAEEMEGKK